MEAGREMDWTGLPWASSDSRCKTTDGPDAPSSNQSAQRAAAMLQQKDEQVEAPHSTGNAQPE